MPKSSLCGLFTAAVCLLTSSCSKEALPEAIKKVVSNEPPTRNQVTRSWCERVAAGAKDGKGGALGAYWDLGTGNRFRDLSTQSDEPATWELSGNVLKISNRGNFIVEKYEQLEGRRAELVLSQAGTERSFDLDCADEEEFYSRPNRLRIAASDGDLETLSKLLAAGGVDINGHARGDSKTALMAAASAGKVEVVRFLVEHGARLDVVDRRGKTALDIATRLHRRKVIPLLEAAARGEPLPPPEPVEPSEVAVADDGPPVALSVAALRGGWHSEDLLDTVLLFEGETFQRRMALMPNEASVEVGRWTVDGSMIKFERQTETKIRNTSRSTLDQPQVLPLRVIQLTANTLKLAIGDGELEIEFKRIDPASAKSAIDADAVPANTADKLDQAMKVPGVQQLIAGEDGKALQHTAFCNAAALGDTAGVRTFLERGVELDRLDSRAAEPRTALIIATKFQQVEVVKLLLHYGASKSPRDAAGKTALDYARELHHDELIALLR